MAPTPTTPTSQPAITTTTLVSGPADKALPTSVALRWLRLEQDVLSLTPEQAADRQRSIAAPEVADRMARLTEASVRAAQLLFGDAHVAYRVVPIGVLSHDCDSATCSVDIWALQILAIEGQPSVEKYSTFTFTMSWGETSDGQQGWREESESFVAGPQPESRGAASAPGEVSAALDAFTGVESP